MRIWQTAAPEWSSGRVALSLSLPIPLMPIKSADLKTGSACQCSASQTVMASLKVLLRLCIVNGDEMMRPPSSAAGGLFDLLLHVRSVNTLCYVLSIYRARPLSARHLEPLKRTPEKSPPGGAAADGGQISRRGRTDGVSARRGGGRGRGRAVGLIFHVDDRICFFFGHRAAE